MSRNNRPVGQDDLTAYVDGELNEERRALVEDWLASHPDDMQQVKADMAIRAEMLAALEPLADESLPDRFRVETLKAGLAARRWQGLRRLVAVLALVAVSGAAGWLARGGLPGGAAPMDGAERALAAYRVFVPEKLHPVEVSASSLEHLGTWLGNRIGMPIDIPDLSGLGLTLVGGRLLPGNIGPAGLLMYQNDAGERLTLFIQMSTGGESDFVYAEDGDIQMVAWRSEDLAYVLTGPVSKASLTMYATRIHVKDI
jgi:anti-sigma factor RsiW